MGATPQGQVDTVVLIHGLWMTPRSWEGWAAAVHRTRHAVSPPPGRHGPVRGPVARRPRPDRRAEHGHDRRRTTTGSSGRCPDRRSSWATRSAACSPRSSPTGVSARPASGAPRGGEGGAQGAGVSSLRASPVLRSPVNRTKAVQFTPDDFAYAFGNTLSREDSDRAWRRYAVPGAGRVFFEGAFANLDPRSPARSTPAVTTGHRCC